MRKALFVTALALEMEAVRAHLTDVGAAAGRDGTIFESGSFSDRGQDWLVVVAESGAGTHPAQNVVSQAHNLFGEFEVQILVGIGGSRKEDAGIGSVVASSKVYMPYSGKAGKNGFTSRPETFPVDLRLLNIAKKVGRDKVWPSRVHPPLGGELPPLDAYPVPFPPNARVAPIASIEAVLDDPASELEALIAQHYSDTCVVEMEGYGAVYAASAERTPSIVVRGVSDMTQDKSHESDAMLQPIAACHAAAFAFEMLSHWGQLHEPPAGHNAPQPPSRTEPDALSKTSDHAALADAEETQAAPSLKARVSIVLNVSVDFGPEDQGRIERFQSSLRAIAADENIEIIEALAGSLWLFVADPNASLERVGEQQLREELSAQEDAELLGLVPIEDFEGLKDIRTALAAASGELLNWPATLPDGERLTRPELGQLQARVTGSISSTTALLGAPGAGKSALLATLGSEYAGRGWPVLAIKADLLETDINSETALRDRLGLEDLPSNFISRLAAFGPVLLLIDQLDALAGYLDVRTGRLSVLLNLVRKLGGLDNVHIVLSSRTFEFHHDVRLRSVSAESLSLELPAWSEVMAILEARGVSPAGWPADAQEVMRTPQALATYLQLNSRYSSEPFTSYQAMLERLWGERVLVGDNGSRRDQLATEIADRMADEESLWLATARFTDRMTELQALAGAGVLTMLDTSIGFSHQTLFEFTLARSFAREPGRLSKFVLERQSSLFLRPKLWAGLTYLRATDTNVYHGELEAIWRADLRAHLRVLLIDFLGSQPAPTDREALLIEEALTKVEQRLRAYRALAGSEGWFARFGKSFIANAMTQAGAIADAQISVLTQALTFSAEDVVRLMRERWLPNSSNDSRAWWVLQSSPRWTPEMLDIALTILGRTEVAPAMIDHQVNTLGVEQPEFALQLVRAKLDRDLADACSIAAERAAASRPEFASADEEIAWRIAQNAREPIRQLLERGNDWDSVAAVAEQSPRPFLDILWPWFLETFAAIERVSDGDGQDLGYPLPYVADFRFDGENDLDLPEPALLDALRVAVEKLAELDPDGFAAWLRQNETVALMPVQRILAHGITHQPEQLATLGFDFVLGDQRRFYLGSIHDVRGRTKALIGAVSPFWTEEQMQRFETAVRAYQPAPPTHLTEPSERMGWRHLIRRTQLDLLRSLPAHQMSAAAKRQVVEGERRYGSRRSGVTFSGARWIGPVLDADAMAKAADDDIVNAFKELPDATGWDHPRNWMTGGNIQLARAFSEFAKHHPERAIRILDRLDRDTGTRASAYTLDALSEAADPALVFGLLRDTVGRGFDGEEFRQSAARALERLSNRKIAIGDEVIALLEGWLQTPILKEEQPGDENSGDDGDNDDLIDTGTDDTAPATEEDAIHRSLLWGYGGFGTVPGGDYPVIETLLHLRLLRQEPDQALTFLSAYLDREKSLKVWEALARFLPYLGPADQAARNAFLDRLFREVPGLIGTRLAAHFLANAHHDDPDLVDQHLDAWKTAVTGVARQTYGEIVALVALTGPELEWGQRRLEELIADEAGLAARAGAALSAANLFAIDKERERASHLLVRLLAIGGKGVWEAVFDLFRMVDELKPDDATIALLSEIADKLPDAPQLNATFVVDRLATLLPHQAPLVGRLSLGLVEKWKAELGDVRTATAMATSQLVDLAITLHRLGPETREIGTRLFEHLIETEAYEARQMLDEIDNRFRQNAPQPRRRRLRRRSEANARRRSRDSGQ